MVWENTKKIYIWIHSFSSCNARWASGNDNTSCGKYGDC